MPAHADVIGYYLPLSLSHPKSVEILWGITLEAAGWLFVTTGDILSNKSYRWIILPLLVWYRLSPCTVDISASVVISVKRKNHIKRDTKKHFPSEKRSSATFLGFLRLKDLSMERSMCNPAQVTDKTFSILSYRLKWSSIIRCSSLSQRPCSKSPTKEEKLKHLETSQLKSANSFPQNHRDWEFFYWNLSRTRLTSPTYW